MLHRDNIILHAAIARRRKFIAPFSDFVIGIQKSPVDMVGRTVFA
jgi:hypothetical protein